MQVVHKHYSFVHFENIGWAPTSWTSKIPTGILLHRPLSNCLDGQRGLSTTPSASCPYLYRLWKGFWLQLITYLHFNIAIIFWFRPSKPSAYTFFFCGRHMQLSVRCCRAYHWEISRKFFVHCSCTSHAFRFLFASPLPTSIYGPNYSTQKVDRPS